MRGLTLALTVVMACGGDAGETEPETTETTTGSETETTTSETGEPLTAGVRTRTEDEWPAPPEQPWAEMDQAARAQYMGRVIVPYFRELFQEYDPERYASFGCATCHGSEMTERGFAMPNPDILELHPTGTPEQQQMAQDHPRMVRLMFNHVVPPMRHALQMDPYDPDTGEGFSCYTCHPAAETAEPEVALLR